MKRSLFAAGMTILATFAAVPVTAQGEPDRHIPDLSAGYCPGGKQGRYHSPTGHGYCDGMHYPDGSYWHQIQPNYGGPATMQCVVNPEGGATPKPAPPGSCGGAV